MGVCVSVCLRACVRALVGVCVCADGGGAYVCSGGVHGGPTQVLQNQGHISRGKVYGHLQ